MKVKNSFWAVFLLVLSMGRNCCRFDIRLQGCGHVRRCVEPTFVLCRRRREHGHPDTMPTGAQLWWDGTDGLGVLYLYETDEIAGIERLRIAVSAPVEIVRVFLTDLFNEGYLERGACQLNGSGSWFSFSADPGQVPGSTNGELALALDSECPGQQHPVSGSRTLAFAESEPRVLRGRH